MELHLFRFIREEVIQNKFKGLVKKNPRSKLLLRGPPSAYWSKQETTLKSFKGSRRNVQLIIQTQTHLSVSVSCEPSAWLGRYGQRWSSAPALVCGICPWLARRRYKAAHPLPAGARPSQLHRVARWHRCKPVEARGYERNSLTHWSEPE